MNTYLNNIINWLADNLIHFKNEVILTSAIFISFISPIKGLFYIVGTAVIIDTFYAIYASIKLHGLKSIESNKLFNSVVKTFFYMGTILLAFLISTYMTDGQLFGIKYLIPKFICGLWISIEAKSIDETNIKLGNRSFLQVIKDTLRWANTIKKDINKLKNLDDDSNNITEG